MCKKKSLSTDGVKYELVRRLADEPNPIAQQVPSLESFPSSISSLRKLPIYYLKKILTDNGLCSLGKKDDLVLRLFLLRNNRKFAIAEQERQDLLKTISVAEDCIREQWKDTVIKYPSRKRKHSSEVSSKSKINVPSNVKSITDIKSIFNDLKLYLISRGGQETHVVQMVAESVGDKYKLFFEIGSVVKIKLTDEYLSLGHGWFSACS